MDGIHWKILLTWMIWGYLYFRKPPSCTCPRPLRRGHVDLLHAPESRPFWGTSPDLHRGRERRPSVTWQQFAWLKCPIPIKTRWASEPKSNTVHSTIFSILHEKVSMEDAHI